VAVSSGCWSNDRQRTRNSSGERADHHRGQPADAATAETHLVRAVAFQSPAPEYAVVVDSR
jgi:hypothetical protein